jgi:hypothetical protein
MKKDQSEDKTDKYTDVYEALYFSIKIDRPWKVKEWKQYIVLCINNLYF